MSDVLIRGVSVEDVVSALKALYSRHPNDPDCACECTCALCHSYRAGIKVSKVFLDRANSSTYVGKRLVRTEICLEPTIMVGGKGDGK